MAYAALKTAWIAALCVAALSGTMARPAMEKPNIVVLFVDDLGFGDTSFTGHPTVSSPNIDKLGTAAHIHTQAYVCLYLSARRSPEVACS